ncbi:MAG: glycogen synthase, partial [Planctomycetota bacterium]
MHIVMITPEIAPVAKVGGLADVITGLSKDLISKGHSVEVMLPMYHCMRYDRIDDLQEVYEELWVPHFDNWGAERVYAGTVDGIPCKFFPCGDRFHRDAIYGFDDDMMRFAHFNRSVMEYMLKTETFPDIIHCHDWQTGLVPVLLYEMYQQYGFARSRALYTIHNIEHQGQCWFGGDLLGSIGLDEGKLATPDRLLDNEKPGQINMMKGGIVYSNFITTVSPNYCNEIRSHEGGKGLAPTLNAHNGKLGGVLNGLDCQFWNPETDPHLTMNYNAQEFERKFANKHALREAMGLADEYRPIVA